MDLILITMVTVAPFLIGNIIDSEKNGKKSAKKLDASKLNKEGYIVCKYGNFDYAYKRV